MWDMKFTKLGGTRVSLLGEKPLRRRTNARSARLPYAHIRTKNRVTSENASAFSASKQFCASAQAFAKRSPGFG